MLPALLLNRILRLASLPLSTRREAPRNLRNLRARSISLFGRRTRSLCRRVKLCSSLTNQVGINHPFEHSLSHTHNCRREHLNIYLYVFHPCRSSRGQSSGKSSKMYLSMYLYNLLLSPIIFFYETINT